MTGPQTIVDIGARYRFDIGDTPASLRVQVANLFDEDSWDVSGNESFGFVQGRRLLVRLAADF